MTVQGGNTSLLIEDPLPGIKVPIENTRSYHIVTLSAKTKNSLEGNKENLLEYLCSHPNVEIEDLSYTTTARRMHHSFRRAYSVGTTVQLVNALGDDLNGRLEAHRVLQSPPIVFLFTGQGSQYPGMAKDLFDTCGVFRKRILELESVAIGLGLPSFLGIISTGDQEASCLSPVQTQVALVSLEIALADLWKTWGIIPDMVIGHSLGEYAALCTAGVLSVYDTIFLVGHRARLMEIHCTPYTHGMLSIESNMFSVENYLKTLNFTTCDIACSNSSSATVVSGPTQDLIALKASLGHTNTRSTMLDVPFAFHSSQVDPILAEFRNIADTIQFRQPDIPVMSTLVAKKLDAPGSFGPEYLIRQSREPVRFAQAIEEIIKQTVNSPSIMWLEIGPNPICLGMLRSKPSMAPEKTLPTLRRNQSCWDTLTRALASLYEAHVDIKWSEYYRERTNGLQVLDLPTYAFDLRNYWIPYEGDWALMKSAPDGTTLTVPRFSSTCLHRIEEASNSDHRAVTFTLDLTNAALLPCIDGHRVNGLSLCPSSVYTVMALAAASYMLQDMPGSPASTDMSVTHLGINRPLVVPHDCDAYEIKVRCEYSDDESNFAVIFRSGTGQSSQKHARCTVKLGQSAHWQREWHRTRHLVKSRTNDLITSSKTESTHRILKDMVYKLFSRVVTYGERYRSLREVFLDGESYEAAAIVEFSPETQTEKFTMSPYWIDAIMHLGGFSINAHPNTPDEFVYISTGWDDLCMAAELSSETQYTSYVRMHDSGHGLYAGDVYLLDGDEIVAMCAGLRFQEMKSGSLHALLQNAVKTNVPSSGSERHVPYSSGDQAATVSTRECNAVPGIRQSYKPQIPVSSVDSVFTKVLAIIAEEIDMDPNDIPENVMFEQLGIDSILRMPIMSKIHEATNIYLSSSAFDDFPTLAALRRHIRDIFGVSNDSRTSNLSSSLSPTIASTPSTQRENTSPELHTPLSEISGRARRIYSRSVLLSGRQISSAPILFLMPDGAGSPSSYAMLPALPDGTAVYGLESPFCHAPSEWNCSFEQVATTYVEAIRKIQPNGPYRLGGWSLGGMYAYEVANQLLHAGEKVQGLLLIDTPNPNFLGHISDPVVELLQDTGLFAAAERVNEGKALQRVKDHMCKCVESLKHYVPAPMEHRYRPDHIFAIWAAHGVEQWNETEKAGEGTVGGDEIRQIQRWMKQRHTQFGSNGWDQLLGEVECHVVEGDHLSILRPPWVSASITFQAVYLTHI